MGIIIEPGAEDAPDTSAPPAVDGYAPPATLFESAMSAVQQAGVDQATLLGRRVAAVRASAAPRNQLLLSLLNASPVADQPQTVGRTIKAAVVRLSETERIRIDGVASDNVLTHHDLAVQLTSGPAER